MNIYAEILKMYVYKIPSNINELHENKTNLADVLPEIMILSIKLEARLFW